MKESGHPFWSIIRRCNASTGTGPVEYRPILPPETLETLEVELHAESSFNAMALLYALDGDRIGRLDEIDMAKHRELFQFVTSSHFGVCVGFQASNARKSVRFIPSFSESMRFPEFPLAVCRWISPRQTAYNKAYPRLNQSDWKTSLADLLKKGESDPLEYDFLFKDALATAPDSITFAAEFATAIRRKDAADAQRRRRTKNREEAPHKNPFKDKILCHWIIAALWCRTPSGVQQALKFPGTQKVLDALKNDWSDLGLSDSRQPHYEQAIENAEAEFEQLLATD